MENKIKFLHQLTKKIINKLNIKFFTQNKFVFIDENHSKLIEIKNNKIIHSDSDIKNINTSILSDTILEIKIIKVPVVSKSHLKNIVINVLKKHSTIKPDNNNADYIILGKEENQYEILTFVSTAKDVLDKFKKKFTLYHVIENLIKYNDFPETCSFITYADNIWFLYTFKNKKFINRHIYYSEDISSLKKKNIYYIDLNDKKADKKHKFLEVPKERIVQSLGKLKNDVFKRQNKNDLKKYALYASGFAAVIILLILQIHLIDLNDKKNSLIKESAILNKKYEEEKAKRGISDEVYKEYLKLFAKKSYVNDFLKNLNQAGNNNIEIERFSYSDNNFVLNGFCADDSKLENAFRLSHAWKDVEFTFTKKNNKTQFNISGKFINEN